MLPQWCQGTGHRPRPDHRHERATAPSRPPQGAGHRAVRATARSRSPRRPGHRNRAPRLLASRPAPLL